MSVKISRILHAGYVIESSNAMIAFDTIFQNPFSGNCHAFPDIEFDQNHIQNLKFDAVFISHFHDDHFCMESLNLLPRSTPIYMFCVHSELLDLIKALGFMNVTSLQLNSPVKIKDIEVIPRRALDEDVDSLFQVKVGGFNILNVVDSWIDYETLDLLQQQGPWDLLMWPFQTMREMEILSPSRYVASDGLIPSEWLEQISILKPKYLVPSSCQFKMEPWSWYNKAFFPITYLGFEQQVNSLNLGIKVQRLEPSETFSLSRECFSYVESLSWIKKRTKELQDYAYGPKATPDLMGDIAKKFPISDEAEVQTLHFCATKLIEIYNANSEGAHEYFTAPVVWQLDLYTTTCKHSLFFQFKDTKILQLVSSTKKIGWKTEISLAKVYSALFEGEALTSLYIRINDIRFDSNVEKRLKDVDAIEDPLIRVLYDGSLGAYQKAQLKRLGISF